MVRINPKDRRVSRAELPVAVPLNVDLDDEVEEAHEHAWFDPESPEWLREKLASGDWDFSKRGEHYKDFEDFHLGVVGAAMGFPLGGSAASGWYESP